jgi:hypothetical protein
MLRLGFSYPYQEPPARSFNALFPHYAQFRSLSRLLNLEAQTEESRGDWSGAMNSSLDAMRLGADVPHGGILIGKLVGMACQAAGRADAWGYAEHLNAAQARAAARRLEEIVNRSVPFADTLQEEKWMAQAGLLEMFQKANWLTTMNSFLEEARNGDEPDSLPKWRLMPILFLRDSKRKIMDNYTRYMDAVIADARQPYAAHPTPPPLPGDIVNRNLLPVFAVARFRDVYESETQNELLLVTLALRAYRLEHGAYPDTLAELVPAYLTRVPSDPFALGGPLRYRREGGNYRLYSVGPDGKDDGGQPVDARRTKEGRAWTQKAMGASLAQRYQVREDSVGDIVAGVNRQ